MLFVSKETSHESTKPLMKKPIRLFAWRPTCSVILLTLAVASAPASRGHAQCSALMVNLSSSCASNKSGFPECQPSTPRRFYLVQTITTTDSYSEEQSSTDY